MKNSGLYNEFQVKLDENPRPDEIAEEDWTVNHPLHWKTVIFLENFSDVPYERILRERKHIDDQLAMLDVTPVMAEAEGAKELASKQHGMWIAELLDNSWSETVSIKMSAYDEETKGESIMTFFIFLREHVGFSKEALILAEQQLTMEKLALDYFDHDIHKLTSHARTYLRQNHQCWTTHYQSTFYPDILSSQRSTRI